MKALILFSTLIFLSIGTFSQEKANTGFKIIADCGSGITSPKSGTMFHSFVGIEAGSQITKKLFLGVGPVYYRYFNSSNGSQMVGGVALLRYSLPSKNIAVPFIDLKGGYGFNTTQESGGLMSATGIGVRYKIFTLGIFCNLNSYSDTESYPTKYRTIGGKQYPSEWGKREVTKTSFIPSLNFGVQF